MKISTSQINLGENLGVVKLVHHVIKSRNRIPILDCDDDGPTVCTFSNFHPSLAPRELALSMDSCSPSYNLYQQVPEPTFIAIWF